MMFKILYLLSTLLILVNAYKETKKDVTVKLTPRNFDKEVMRSKDVWFIMFTTTDCKHCKKIKGKFKLAASKMDGLVKFGEVDLSNNDNGPLGRRFEIKGIPTINIFEYGLKNKRKSKMYEYGGKNEWKSIVTFATNLYEQSNKDRKLTEIHELNKQAKWDRECLENMYCVIVMLPHISQSDAIERKNLLNTLSVVASKNKQKFQKYSWFWMQSGDQVEFMTHFNPEQFPVMIYSKSDHQMTFMKQMYTKENFQKFLDDLILEDKAKFVPAKYELNFKTAMKWDGKDYFKHIEEREAKEGKKKAEKEKRKSDREEKANKEKALKDKKKKEREEKRQKRKEEAEKAMQEPDEPEVKEPDAYDNIKEKAQESKRQAKKKAREERNKPQQEQNVDPKNIDVKKLRKKVADLLASTDHQMKHYADKIPQKVKDIIVKDINRIGKVIEKEPDNNVKIQKLINKLEKDSMKIGEAIYKNVDQTEIDKREKLAKQMPEDAEVIAGIQEFLEKAKTDLVTYYDQIEEELINNLKKSIESLTTLIQEKPVDKDAVEKGIELLRLQQMEIGESIYKQAAIKEKAQKEKDKIEARGENSDEEAVEVPQTEEEVFEIDEDEAEDEDEQEGTEGEDGDDEEEAEGEEEGETGEEDEESNSEPSDKDTTSDAKEADEEKKEEL